MMYHLYVLWTAKAKNIMPQQRRSQKSQLSKNFLTIMFTISKLLIFFSEIMAFAIKDDCSCFLTDFNQLVKICVWSAAPAHNYAAAVVGLETAGWEALPAAVCAGVHVACFCCFDRQHESDVLNKDAEWKLLNVGWVCMHQDVRSGTVLSEHWLNKESASRINLCCLIAGLSPLCEMTNLLSVCHMLQRPPALRL